MYDPTETDISYKYMVTLNEKAAGLKWAVIGGWGVYLHVNDEYLRAFGREYLKSRDIDIFISSKNEEEFYRIVKNMGFKESAYSLRYELIYDREEKKIIHHEKARDKHVFNLIYIFLDVFSERKTKKIGSWVFSELEKAKIEQKGPFPVLDINSMIELKATSFFEREKLDKELKDACDIYALLLYSGKKIKATLLIKKAAEKIISRPDLQGYIAEQVLGDSLKASLVNINLRKFII